MKAIVTSDPKDIVEKLQYLLDRQNILDCCHRYARGLDRHDEAIIESVFHPDAVDNHGAWVGYREDFVKYANWVHSTYFVSHIHHMTSHFCDIKGNEAHAETYVLFCQRAKDLKTVYVGGGRYLDRLEKRDGEWRVSLRRLIMDVRFEADGSSWDTMITRHGSYAGTQDKTDPSYQRPLVVPEKPAAELKARGTARWAPPTVPPA